MDELIDVIDENNKIVGQASRADIYEKFLPHRIVHILVFDPKGRVLLQKRSKQNSFLPGYWGTSSGGHVRSGENFEEAAKRELEEELGILEDPKFLAEGWYEKSESQHKKYIKVFQVVSEGPFKLNDYEGDLVEFKDLVEVEKMIKDGEKFMPELLFVLEKL